MSLTQANATKISGVTATAVDGFSMSYTNSVGIGLNCAPLSTGIANTYIGYSVAEFSVTGSSNAAMGYASGKNISGDGNTYIGCMAAVNATSGGGNIAVGLSAGNTCVFGGCNVLLGTNADVTTRYSASTVAVGAGARAGPSGSVAIGTDARASGIGAISIGTGAVAAGNGTINIGNRVQGSHVAGTSNAPSKYVMQIGADVLKLPGALAICHPVMLSPQWWFYLDGGGVGSGGTGNKRYSDLLLRSANNATTRFTDEFWPNIFDFRGQHRCALEDDENQDDIFPGCVVVSSGRYDKAPTMDDTTPCVPGVRLSRTSNDPRVFGVASRFEAPGGFREYRLGNLGFLRPRDEGEKPRLIVNALGEGAVWVCDANGNICNGDLLTTSSIPGIAMRQDSAVVANHTLGKATCDCDFGSNAPGPVMPTACGSARRVLIGCTYRC